MIELFVKVSNPIPKVVIVIIMNPKIIEFLDPILFFIWELNGAKIIYAIENIEIIIDISVLEIFELGTSIIWPYSFFSFYKYISLSQSCFSSAYSGKNAVTFIIIKFPIKRAIRLDKIIPFF